MVLISKQLCKRLALGGLGLVAVAAVFFLSLQPRNDRNWDVDTSVLPRIELNGSKMTVTDLRDFEWISKDRYEASWRDESFDLNGLDKLDLLVEPFDDSEFAAHVMLSFGFLDGRRLVVSVEARREQGETYGLIAGALRQFELIYIFATEEDIIDLRAAHRGSRVFAFPVKADANFMRQLLLDLCESANKLHAKPEFYATVRDNCATTLLQHADRILDEKIGWQYEIIFPAKIGNLLHRLGLMDTSLSWGEAKERFRIDEIARGLSSKGDYSARIRVKSSLGSHSR